MKAARIHAYGPPDVLVVEEVPRPEPGPNDVLVEVYASSVNPVDCKIRSGGQRGIIHYRLPWILGLDVSGVVVEVGSAVKGFAPGDAVWASPTHRRPGCYAEYVALDASVVAHKPANLSHVEAAGLPLVGLTVWQSMKGRVDPGDEVLVLAGSGGVGTVAIQVAKHLGARVTTTTSAHNEALVRSLGADRVIDYREHDVWSEVSDLDYVLVTLGGGERDKALDAVKRGGTVVSLTEDLPALTHRHGPVIGTVVTGLNMARFSIRGRLRGRRVAHVMRTPEARGMAKLTELCEAGVLQPVVDRVFALDDIVEAHRHSEAGHAAGKIAIQVRQ
ncbi:MAG: NADP-dependent oxidoreductase [Deltaproteobacteria bacterium]|nr:NADP-dependent oxidoreductase [Deltaproteobacteria bacterium]